MAARAPKRPTAEQAERMTEDELAVAAERNQTMTSVEVAALSDDQLRVVMDSLRDQIGWQVFERLVLDYRDKLNSQTLSLPADTDPRILQRSMGVIEGIERVLRQPEIIDQALRRREKEREANATTT